MIPLLVDTWPDFGLFRVVRPIHKALCKVYTTIFCKKILLIKINTANHFINGELGERHIKREM